MEGLLDRPLNLNKLLKEQFVSNLTGSSLLEIAVLSTIVPAVVVLRKWSSRGIMTGKWNLSCQYAAVLHI